MTREVLYTYLGANGTITSKVFLEDVYYVRKLKLTADNGCVLKKKDSKETYSSVIIPEVEEDGWEEIKQGQV